MKIYTAGPITGLSYEEVMIRYREQTSTLKAMGYTVLCPMVGKNHLKDEKSLTSEGYRHPTSTNRAIKGRDRWMVAQSDIILVDFTDSTKASIGSCMEMAWADALDKHVIAVIPEGNVHRHAFILECADVIFTEITEAYVYLENLIVGIN